MRNPPPAPTVSVVLGTLNRVHFLRRAVVSIPPACGDLEYEIIIVDGGSLDGTAEYLQFLKYENQRVRVIQQGERRGAVAAFNAGFNAAVGEYVAATNDDCEYVGQPIALAVERLREASIVGQIAVPFITVPAATIADVPETVEGDPHVQYVNLRRYGLVPYANFSVIRRDLGQQLGWWGDYYHYAGDTELSTRVWHAGRRVEPLRSPTDYLIHYEVQDGTRVPNVETAIYNARWRRKQ